MESYQWGGGQCRKGTVNKKQNWQSQNRQEEVKNSIGNGEAKELVCMTHGHELSGGILERRSYSAEGDKGKKKNWTTVVA